MLKPSKRQKTKSNNLPTNLEIEKSVKEYLKMFYWEDLKIGLTSAQISNKSNERVKAFGPILIGELSRI